MNASPNRFDVYYFIGLKKSQKFCCVAIRNVIIVYKKRPHKKKNTMCVKLMLREFSLHVSSFSHTQDTKVDKL